MISFGSIIEALFASKYVVLVLFLAIITALQFKSYNRLSNFKGPFWAGMTNMWMAKSVYYRNAHLDLFRVHQNYGSTFPP